MGIKNIQISVVQYIDFETLTFTVSPRFFANINFSFLLIAYVKNYHRSYFVNFVRIVFFHVHDRAWDELSSDIISGITIFCF